jgi:citrate lyase subunit beta/citryl-CoA lyase
MLDKAADSAADALIVDLEDAVAPSKKDEARAITNSWLSRWDPHAPSTWVRINVGQTGEADLEALSDSAIDGLMIPKARHSLEVDEWRHRIERQMPNSALLILIETAAALRHVDEIASIPGVSQLMIGEADLGAELSISPDHTVWDSLRLEVVVASAAAGINPPIGPVEPDFSNPERLEAQTRHLRGMGFTSRAVIHPAQIEPVHRALTPSREEVDQARQTLARHEEALASGVGAYVGADGIMVDEAMVRRARNVLALARHAR